MNSGSLHTDTAVTHNNIIKHCRCIRICHITGHGYRLALSPCHNITDRSPFAECHKHCTYFFDIFAWLRYIRISDRLHIYGLRFYIASECDCPYCLAILKDTHLKYIRSGILEKIIIFYYNTFIGWIKPDSGI